MVPDAFGDSWQIYATGAKRLEYCGNCGDADWFRFRVKAVIPGDIWELEQDSGCNPGPDIVQQVIIQYHFNIP